MTQVLGKATRLAYAFLNAHPRLKRFVRAGLARTGLLSVAVPYVCGLGVVERRKEVAARHLRGAGIEIGAMHFPLPVAEDVKVTYVDRISKQEAIRRYPGLDPSRMVTPGIIEDGFTLASVPERSQDFVIANHVLEHSPNPLQALRNWVRVLRPGGALYVTVPVAEKCFDRGRPETTVGHMVEDYRLCGESRFEEFRARNFAHYDEWVRISAPNVARDEGRTPPAMTPEEIAAEIRHLAQSEEEIHFHTFSPASFAELLGAFRKLVDPSVGIAEVVDVGGEVIAVLRKCP
jgi:SAM-dependent methyltransferase